MNSNTVFISIAVMVFSSVFILNTFFDVELNRYDRWRWRLTADSLRLRSAAADKDQGLERVVLYTSAQVT